MDTLFRAMNRNVQVVSLFRAYRADDWKKHIQFCYTSPKPVLLYQTDRYKLILTGWRAFQYQEFLEKRSIVHTLVVHGKLYTRIHQPIEDQLSMRLHTNWTFHPLTHWNHVAQMTSASLHLVEECEAFRDDFYDEFDKFP
jgi:hypothetical protein